MKNNLLLKPILLSTTYYLLSTILCGCQNQQLYKDSRIMMGTIVGVMSPDKRATQIVFSEIKRIEDLFSIYNPDSEISQLNKLGKLNVTPDTLYILKKAKEFWVASEGAFDVTVGPLMNLWGFTDKKYHLASRRDVKKAMGLVGFDKIIFNDNNNMIKFKIQGMRIDLGAIAKGYAIDCAVKRLKEKGINSALVNAAGDIYCLGDKPRTFGIFEFLFPKVRGKFGKPWKVGIKDPRGEGVADYLELKNKAVSTSGDYEQYFIKDQRRYSHIFNPKTGYPADSGVVSVTVVAPDCLTADALSTAIFVLGKEKGGALAKKFKDVEVKMVEEKDVQNSR